jgi:2-polyprenyl-6-methoxyphenol hydroxylase-like FAD-dependent oxidoreductase
MDDPNIQFGWTLLGSPGVINPPNEDYTIYGKPAADIAKVSNAHAGAACETTFADFLPQSLTARWHPRVKPLFDTMSESDAAFWKITCSDPEGIPEWPNQPRVTVIGDAVHAMTPAGGNGANTAMRDSALLGRLLAEAGGFKEGVTGAYEKEMRGYAGGMVKQSFGMASKQFGVTIDASTPTIW